MVDNKSGKVLILFNSIPYFLDFFNRKDVTGSWALREVSFPFIIIRKITRWLKLPQVYWYGDWKKNLQTFDTIIIFAPLKEVEILNYIKKSNETIRIIYWYWNPVLRIRPIDDKLLDGTELWSFDPADCKKYKMKFNTTFYFKNIPIPQNEAKYDTFFVGLDKGRSNYLKELQNKIEAVGATTYFKIIPNIKEKISYQKYLELVSKTKCIIDIIPEGQSGLTVRPMESIFFRKKLITSDPSIASADFYNKRNIFIIGKDDESYLKEFIDSPYIPIDESIVYQYDLREWLKRFIKN